VSIIRVGLAETDKYSEGYERIFGTQKKSEDKPAKSKKKTETKAKAKKKPAAKASAKKKKKK
jgi:hypothetical protein